MLKSYRFQNHFQLRMKLLGTTCVCVFYRGTHSVLTCFILILGIFSIGIVVLCVSRSVTSDSL